mgnify:CR=1 FL=1
MDKEQVEQTQAMNADPVTEQAVEAYAVLQASSEAQDAKVSAMEDILEHTDPPPIDSAAALKALEAILEGASPDDAAALKADDARAARRLMSVDCMSKIPSG